MLTDRSKIDVLVDMGDLIEWQLQDKRRPVRNVVYLSPQAFDWLTEPKGDEHDDLEIVRIQSREQIASFIYGDLTVRQCMKDLSGRKGVCEWKRPTRAPGMRIIGTLLASDVFVGFMAISRSELPHQSRAKLDDGETWKGIIAECQKWHDTMFPNHPPIRVRDINHDEIN